MNAIKRTPPPAAATGITQPKIKALYLLQWRGDDLVFDNKSLL